MVRQVFEVAIIAHPVFISTRGLNRWLSDILFDMKVSTRPLVRDLPRVKAAARKGQKVEIYDGRTGEAFFLTAKPKKTFGELAEMAKGVYSGPRDLSSREGFDA